MLQIGWLSKKVAQVRTSVDLVFVFPTVPLQLWSKQLITEARMAQLGLCFCAWIPVCSSKPLSTNYARVPRTTPPGHGLFTSQFVKIEAVELVYMNLQMTIRAET